MSLAIKKLMETLHKALKVRPQVGDFPYISEVLRQSGVNISDKRRTCDDAKNSCC
jgi:hypothetical protein